MCFGLQLPRVMHNLCKQKERVLAVTRSCFGGNFTYFNQREIYKNRKFRGNWVDILGKNEKEVVDKTSGPVKRETTRLQNGVPRRAFRQFNFFSNY